MNSLQRLRRPGMALAVVGFLLFLTPSAQSAEAPTTPKKITTVEGITEYQLDNGLRILLCPDPSTSNFTVNLTVLVGSRHEGYGETGMAHLLEHMVFKGTPTHGNIPKILRDHGARWNGTTNDDRTNYFESMEGTDENLEFGIRFEADRLVNSFIKREDLLSEMTVVRNEFERGENSPQAILHQRMMAAAYEWHNYGKSTIGNRSDIERVPIENLQAFYKKFYQPDNAVFIVTGKFDNDRALELITKYFGALKKPDRKLDNTYTEEPAQDGERVAVLRRVGKVGATGAVYHIPAAAHEDCPALEILAGVLTNEPDGRLYKALVETKKATRAFASASALHDPGVLTVMTQLDAKNSVEDARDAMLATLENLSKEKFTTDEVDRAKQRFTTRQDLMMTNSNALANVLSEWSAKGDWRLFFVHRDRIAKVTAADLDRVAAQYLQRNNRTVGIYVPSDKPERAEIPASPSVVELVKDYKGSQSVEAGEAFDPTPANIEKRVTRSDLPSGLKLAVLPKKTRGEMATVHLTLRYGNEESLQGYQTASGLLAAMIQRGTQKHSRREIQDAFSKLGARFSLGGGLGSLNVSLECKRKNLPEALKLVGEVLREPAFPSQEFEILKNQQKERLTSQLTEPSALAQNSLERKRHPFSKNDIRYVPTLEESLAQLEEVSLDKVRKLYADQLGAQAGELVLVGDFDPESTPKIVQDLIKDWKPGAPYKRIATTANTEVAGSQEVIDTPDKANAVYYAGHDLALSENDPDFAALRLANFIFGEGALASRLATRVRGTEGLSYSVNAGLTISPQDKNASFTMFAICNPANIDKVDSASKEELAKMLKDGVTDKEVAEAKKAYLKMLKTNRSGDGPLANQLANGLHNGRTFAYYADLEKKIDELTPEQVSAAFRKHIKADKLIVVRAGDFKAKKGSSEK
jgi:zinc protease